MVDITTEITIDAEQLQNALGADQEQSMEFILNLVEYIGDEAFTEKLVESLGGRYG